MAGVRLEFAQFGHFDYFNIYRNPVSTDKENLEQPIGTSLTMYYEDLTTEPNNDYYYRIGVVRDSIEEFSEEIHVRTEVMFDPPYNLIVEFKNDETNRLELNWKVGGFVDEQRYYCSETQIDPLNLPVSKAVLAGDVREYTDIAVEKGKTYNILIGAVKNGVEKLSSAITIIANELYKNKFFNLNNISFFSTSTYLANADEVNGGLEFGTTVKNATPVLSLTNTPSTINFEATFDFTILSAVGEHASMIFLCRSLYFGNSYAKSGTFIFITTTYVGIGYGSNAETGASTNTRMFYRNTTINTKHACKIKAVGANISLYIDGVLIVTFTDTKYAATSGKFGFSAYADSGVLYKINDLAIQVL